MNRKRSAQTAVSTTPSDVAPAKSRVWLFRVLALVGGSGAFFGLLELGLRIAGVGHSVSFFVPDPAGRPGVLVENHQFSRRYFSEKLVRIPQTEAFARVKPEGALRVFVRKAIRRLHLASPESCKFCSKQGIRDAGWR